jgi:hypothetical protein
MTVPSFLFFSLHPPNLLWGFIFLFKNAKKSLFFFWFFPLIFFYFASGNQKF